MARRSGLRICLGVSALFLVIVTAVVVTLMFTIFKVKDPDISVHPVGLENLDISLSPNATLNLGLVFTIINPNYGSFKYVNSTGYVNYYNITIAEVPMESQYVPARSTINVTTSADFMVGKLIYDPRFWSDIEDGTFDLTSSATLSGKVRMLKVFKLKATAYSTCDISIDIISKNADTKCVSRIKL